MTNFIMLMIVVATLAATGAVAAPCAKPSNISVEVNVEEAPITIVRDISVEDLRAVSAWLRQQPAHPILGFYAGTVGYVLRGIEVLNRHLADGSACPGLQIKADLVAADRRIAIARELVDSPCRLRAALDHYRHHADAASLALHRFAFGLQAKLGRDLELRIHSQQGTPDELRQYVDALLDAAVADFSASLPRLQRDVDTKDEIQRLSAPCDGV